MATVPSPRTWVAGEKPTATLLNAHVRDAVAFLLNTPTVSAYNASAQTLATGIIGWTSINLPNESYDNDGIHSTVTNNSRFTIVTPGRYLLIGHVTFAAATSNTNRAARFWQNGTTAWGTTRVRSSNTNVDGVVIAMELPLVQGDYVEFQAAHDEGVNLDTTAGENFTSFQARWMGTGA